MEVRRWRVKSCPSRVTYMLNEKYFWHFNSNASEASCHGKSGAALGQAPLCPQSLFEQCHSVSGLCVGFCGFSLSFEFKEKKVALGD